MTYRTAFIYVNDVFAGELCETDYGYSFAYSKEYLHIDNARAVSLTLPLSEEEYRSRSEERRVGKEC